jgi:hypothetical protein
MGKPSKRVTGPSGDQPAPTHEESWRTAIRMKIRTALTGVAVGNRLEELCSALEVAMLEFWGVTASVTITLTPRAENTEVDMRDQEPTTAAA